MPFPVALIPVAISAVRSLLRLHVRVDDILSVKEVSASLPFALPPMPTVDFADTDDMLEYFKSDEGTLMLEVADKAIAFQELHATPPAERRGSQVQPLLELYYQATGKGVTPPARLGPQRSENLLTYYLVESYRVSHHPATVRVLLATADTLLEFAGENASLFISNPKTAHIVGVLFSEFAGRRDFDDEPLDRIFTTLLGSAVIAAMENKDVLPEHPALLVLYAALGEVRAQQGDDFAARIISAEGFQQVVSSYLTIAAKDPAFLDHTARFAGTIGLDDEVRQTVRAAFSATLTKLGTDFASILTDPAAFRGVLEAAVIAAAANAEPLIRTLDDDSPVLAAVLQAVAGQVSQHQELFAALGNGALLGELYRVALQAVAANLDLNADGVTSMVERIVGGLANELAHQALQDTLQALAASRGLAIVNRLLARTVALLAEEPQMLVGNNPYARAVVGAVLTAGIPLLHDGLDVDDLVAVVQAGLRSAAGNLALVEMDTQLREVLATLGKAMAADGDLAARLATPESRKDTLLVVLKALAANPAVWKEFETHDIMQPLVTGLIEGLRSDPSGVLTGPAMVEALRMSLRAINRRGSKLAAEVLEAHTANPNVTVDIKPLMHNIVTRTLQAANEAIGRTIAGEDVPAFLGRAIDVVLRAGLQTADALDSALRDVHTEFDTRV